jgi:hypothetical protein
MIMPYKMSKEQHPIAGIILRISLLLAFILPVTQAFPAAFRTVAVRIADDAGPVQMNVAGLLVDRLNELGPVSARLATDSTPVSDRDISVLLGIPTQSEALKNQFAQRSIPYLTDLAPGPEGFLLQLVRHENKHMVIAAGIDDRGCLYAIGELLRQITTHEDHAEIPEGLYVRTAPAFEIRGTQYGQSGVAKKHAGVRNWTDEETQRVVLDYALAGANIFSTEEGPMYDFIKSYGLMTQGGFGANTAGAQIPDAWHASESIGRLGYVCLSVPEAREYMLKKCDEYFRSAPSFDLVKFHGGDGGGCECDRCDPYGYTFIKTVEEMAGIIHQYHPDTRVYFTNQKFDNADDSAIFRYLQDAPRPWLWAWGYGPGSDATSWQPGHRQTHRMDLFRYPGFGPYSLYPKEILHQLPPLHHLVYYNEITHWKYAQHAYIQMYPRADRNGDLPPWWSHEIYERRPDQFLTMVYNRLTFYAWPRYYHRVFNDLMRYGIGDITHSSGHHDHFNQWMWQRLLWNPRMTVEEVLDEYCRAWFGREAAPLMAEAILQLEENLEEQPGNPLPDKKGIFRYYELVKAAGDKMPAHRMQHDWLWRMYMQKGSLDRYTQLRVRQQMDVQAKVEQIVAEGLKSGDYDNAVRQALTLMDTLPETAEMVRLRKAAGRLGDESNLIFGVRNDGYFNLEHDFIGHGWLERQLQRTLEAPAGDKTSMLKMITDYEDPGEGGFYDNLGTANHAPHVVRGYPYDHGQPYVAQMLSEGNRPSQRSMHFTQDEAQGVTLHYDGLDPRAEYRVRFTFVRPWYQERYAFRMNQKSQSIYADSILIAEDVELPPQMSDFFTCDIPAEATSDGALTIRLKKADDVANGDRVTVEQWRNAGGWGTLVSEVWLMKKE